MTSAPPTEPAPGGPKEPLLLDGLTELKLPPGDHTLRTQHGIHLEVRRGCALVGVEGGFDWIGVSNANDGPGATKLFRGSVTLNPGGAGRFRVPEGPEIEEGQPHRVVFDVRPAA